MEAKITLRVNGEERTVTTEPRRSLQEVLREDLELTGTKCGCGKGQCGACTVLLDGKCVQSCMVAISTVGDANVCRDMDEPADYEYYLRMLREKGDEA